MYFNFNLILILIKNVLGVAAPSYYSCWMTIEILNFDFPQYLGSPQ